MPKINGCKLSRDAMTDHERTQPTTYDSAAWALLGALVVAVAGLQLWKPLPVEPASLLVLLTACGALSCTAFFYRRVRVQENFAIICVGLMQVLLFSAIGSVLSYMLAREGGALWDNRLEAWDVALGFDWLAYVRLVDAQAWLVAPVRIAYASLIPQIIVLVLALGFTSKLAELRRMLLAAMLGGTITILLSAVFPAVGYYVHHGLAAADFDHIRPWAGLVHQADFTALRDGTMTSLRLTEVQGIVTFPSYHAGLATVTVWGFWVSRIAWLRWPGVALALATIFATPIDGGHYLVDVLAGMAVGAIAIAATRRAVGWTPAAAFRSSPFRRSRAAFAR